MRELFVHRCQVVHLPTDEAKAAAALTDLRQELGPRIARRMSALGICLSAVLRAHSFEDDPALLYTTTYTEAQALEKFIDSFPHVSPLLFQMSIHPGGAEQALIARQQPVTEFFPLAGEVGLISQALRMAFLTRRPRVVWVGGEERGAWLLEANCASERTFAWALSLSEERTGAEARVLWSPETASDSAEGVSTLRFFEALENRRPWTLCERGFGRFEWEWA